MQLSAAAAGGTLDTRQRELIALTVGDTNDCSYCVAAHGGIGTMVGLSPRPDRSSPSRSRRNRA